MKNAAAFTRTINGKAVSLYQLMNAAGTVALFSNYGARIISLHFNGVNMVPDFPSIDSYVSAIAPYHGATIGRYANRIAGGKFELDGSRFTLPINNPPNHLHGGPAGFHAQVWEVQSVTGSSVAFTYLSINGEEGFPGNVQITVTYSVTQNNELEINYTATTDAPTPFNVTNHAFFNLNGKGNVLNHRLQLAANYFTPADATLIPTGELRPVAETAFDFRESKTIGQDIGGTDDQLIIGGGYDHNFILDEAGNSGCFYAATAIGDISNIRMEVYTTEPGLQFFSGNFEAVAGDADTYRNTFCLETQHYPDAPNQPGFPDTILRPGKVFESTTIYQFSLQNEG